MQGRLKKKKTKTEKEPIALKSLKRYINKLQCVNITFLIKYKTFFNYKIYDS